MEVSRTSLKIRRISSGSLLVTIGIILLSLWGLLGITTGSFLVMLHNLLIALIGYMFVLYGFIIRAVEYYPNRRA